MLLIFRDPKNKSGFTIVELLIVVVIIGVLAAITIVAFSGVKARADDARLVSEAKSWLSILNTYKLATGHYPHVEGETAVCLTTKPLPAVGDMPEGSCMTSVSVPGFSLANYDAGVYTQLRDAGITGVPDGSFSTTLLPSSGADWGSWRSRSIVYNRADNIIYYVAGNKGCPGGFAKIHPVNGADVTSCSAELSQ